MEPAQTEEDYDDDEDEEIRCICGNNNPKDKRAFIGCDECSVWQHNVCMGMPEDEEDVPDSYLCERCGPDDHKETLQAIERGERIWEARNKIYANEKKMSKNRKGKGVKPGWLKRDVPDGEEQAEVKEETPSLEAGSKRKRAEVVQEAPPPPPQEVKSEEDEKPTRASRQDKRRKPSAPPPDVDTAIVEIDSLPADRKKIAEALSKVIADDVNARTKSGAFRIPDGHTAKSLGEYHAVRIEYAMKMNHEGPSNQAYKDQFRALFANLKKNQVLLQRLFEGSMTADELSTMSSSDMASEELQKERAAMKEQLDRQAVAVQQEGPRYRRTHKGDELIEEVNQGMGESGDGSAAPVRERTSMVDTEMTDAGSPTTVKMDGAGSPTTEGQPLRVDTRRRESMTASAHERRQSSQQFDMNNIWAKTAQSPTMPSSGPRPMQMPPRRRSSVQVSQQADAGTKDDVDIDRMLQDDDEETYSPADYTGGDAIVWRGQLVQGADNVSPTVNARYVAGRDITSTVAWRDLLPSKMAVDGRLRVDKAEEYLCSLQWSSNSDVSVLALTPYDDAEGFEGVFQYFKSRERYAVVKNDKPAMVKDLYIIPLDAGAEMPEHINLLEFNRLGQRVEEKCLLATFVISRSPETPSASQQPAADSSSQSQGQTASGVNGHHLPQHMRAGPSGSPLNASGATFSPTNTAYGGASIPPNPYTPTPPQSSGMPPQHALPAQQQQAPQPSANPLVNEILGSLQYAPTAVQVVAADPAISREKLLHLRRIMEEDLSTRTDISKLAERLFAEG